MRVKLFLSRLAWAGSAVVVLALVAALTRSEEKRRPDHTLTLSNADINNHQSSNSRSFSQEVVQTITDNVTIKTGSVLEVQFDNNDAYMWEAFPLPPGLARDCELKQVAREDAGPAAGEGGGPPRTGVTKLKRFQFRAPQREGKTTLLFARRPINSLPNCIYMITVRFN